MALKTLNQSDLVSACTWAHTSLVSKDCKAVVFNPAAGPKALIAWAHGQTQIVMGILRQLYGDGDDDSVTETYTIIAGILANTCPALEMACAQLDDKPQTGAHHG